MLGKHQQVSVIGGEPPHLILDSVELVIFRMFHEGMGTLSTDVANAERLFSRPYSDVECMKSKGSRIMADLGLAVRFSVKRSRRSSTTDSNAPMRSTL